MGKVRTMRKPLQSTEVTGLFEKQLEGGWNGEERVGARGAGVFLDSSVRLLS